MTIPLDKSLCRLLSPCSAHIDSMSLYPMHSPLHSPHFSSYSLLLPLLFLFRLYLSYQLLLFLVTHFLHFYSSLPYIYSSFLFASISLRPCLFLLHIDFFFLFFCLSLNARHLYGLIHAWCSGRRRVRHSFPS